MRGMILNLCILRMLEDTVSLGSAHLWFVVYYGCFRVNAVMYCFWILCYELNFTYKYMYLYFWCLKIKKDKPGFFCVFFFCLFFFFLPKQANRETDFVLRKAPAFTYRYSCVL